MNNNTKFILTNKSPFLHYLLSCLMIVISIILLLFSHYLLQYKENFIENKTNLQTQYLNDLKFIKQHKICKIYDNKTLNNLTDKLNSEYKNYALKFNFTNSYFLENYNNLYLRYIGQLYVKIPDNSDVNVNDLLYNIKEKFPGILHYNSCFKNENTDDLYCQISLNFYSKNICL